MINIYGISIYIYGRIHLLASITRDKQIYMTGYTCFQKRMDSKESQRAGLLFRAL